MIAGLAFNFDKEPASGR